MRSLWRPESPQKENTKRWELKNKARISRSRPSSTFLRNASDNLSLWDDEGRNPSFAHRPLEKSFPLCSRYRTNVIASEDELSIAPSLLKVLSLLLLLVPYIHDSLSGGKEQSLERLVSSAAVRLGQLELAVRGLSSSMFRGGVRVCRLLKQDLHTRLGSNNCWLGTGIFWSQQLAQNTFPQFLQRSGEEEEEVRGRVQKEKKRIELVPLLMTLRI